MGRDAPPELRAIGPASIAPISGDLLPNRQESRARPRSAREEWRENWPLVAIAAVGCGTSTSGFVSLATLLPPILSETGWTRVQAMSVMLIFSVVALLMSPFLGRLVDRLGVRRVTIPGVIFFALSVSAVGLSGKSIQSWWLVWVIASCGIQFVGSAVWAAAIAPRFVASRGLALGLTMAGAGLAPLLVPVVSTMISEAYGWRYFYFALAGFAVLCLLPAMYFLLPQERKSGAQSAASEPDTKSGDTLVQAFSTGLYWRLILAIFLVASAINFLLLTTPTVLLEKGYDPITAAAIASMYGPAHIVSRIGGGFLLDRVRGDFLAAVIFLLPMVACILLLNAEMGPLLIIAPVFAGLAAGVEVDVMAYLISRYFGLRHYGAIYGVLFGVFSITLGLAPVLGALMRQAYGGYEPVFWIAIIALILSSTLMCTLGRYRY